MTAAYAQGTFPLPAPQCAVINTGILKSSTEMCIALWLQEDFSLLHRPCFILALGIGLEALQYRHVNQEPVGFHGSD